MGESLVQSVQQGAQAAGQAIGGGAAGRMSGVAGSSASGGGAAEPVGGAASAAAGQIFGGDAPVSPAAVGGAVEPAATPASGAIGFEASALGDGSAKRAVGKRLEGPEPWQRVQGAGPESSSGARLSRTLRGDDYPSGNRSAAGAGAGALKPEGSAARSVRALFDAVCSKHGKYGGEVGKVKGCPQCEAEKNILWDAVCSKHGKYGGRGPRTGCPECNKWIIRDAK
jgi:hypothetical protein